MHIVDAQGLGHHPRTAVVIASDQVAADVLRLELLHGLQRAGLERVAKGKQPQHAGCAPCSISQDKVRPSASITDCP